MITWFETACHMLLRVMAGPCFPEIISNFQFSLFCKCKKNLKGFFKPERRWCSAKCGGRAAVHYSMHHIARENSAQSDNFPWHLIKITLNHRNGIGADFFKIWIRVTGSCLLTSCFCMCIVNILASTTVGCRNTTGELSMQRPAGYYLINILSMYLWFNFLLSSVTYLSHYCFYQPPKK